MILCKTKAELKAILDQAKSLNHRIGFVPTMGALHEGHLSLVSQSKTETDLSVVSIFVNPTQFNNQSDFDNYPITLETDCQMLASLETDVLFLPSVEEMYPEKDTRQFELGGLDRMMEGKFRPGHFNGVAQIVSNLFEAVMPNKAYFGQKDFQQLAVIRYMTQSMNYPIEIISCPIVREPDGLAMSSRNMRLSPNQRKKIYPDKSNSAKS
jgi:pantoate--beta-alanine ligase